MRFTTLIRTTLIQILTGTLIAAAGQMAIAQETTVKPVGNPAAAPAGGGQMRTERIQFDDELVEGELRKPELFYLLQKKQFNYKRLIKLRENFQPEMRRDAEKIPMGRTE